MNLYEFSQVNNNEMGLIISRQKEPELYDEILQESMRIVRTSEEIRVTVAKVDTAEERKGRSEGKETRRKPRPTLEKPRNGFCIRCKSTVSANPSSPYCKQCYASWKRYEDKEYEENCCHTCGNDYAATFLKPLCFACFKKYKDVFKFAVA